MDLGYLDMGCIKKQKNQSSFVSNDSPFSSSKFEKNKTVKDTTHSRISKEGDTMNMVGGKNGVRSGQMKTEVTGWIGNGCNDEYVHVPERKDNAPSLGDHNFQGSQHADAYLPSFLLREQQKPLSRMDGGNHLESLVVETDQEEEDISVSTDLPPSPKYTTSEKWIMDQQKKKLLSE